MGNRADAVRHRRDGGATLVEFAIIVPLLFLLIFGIIEFGRVIATYTSVFTAAREGARYGTTVGGDPPHYTDCDGIQTAAMEKVVLLDIDPGDVEVTYHDDDGNKVADCQGSTPPSEDLVPSGSRVVVKVETNFDSPIPIIAVFLDGIAVTSEQKRTIFTGTVG